MAEKNIVETLASGRTSSTFLSIRGYRSASGEIADHTICFHMSYGSALERSIAALSEIVPADDTEATAKAELLASYQKSLEKVRSEPEVLGEVYDRVLDSKGAPIKGIKYHRQSGRLHIFGLAMAKKVLVPGTYSKEVKSKPLTIAKNRLRKSLPVERFRQFIVDPSHCEAIRFEGQTLTLTPDE